MEQAHEQARVQGNGSDPDPEVHPHKWMMVGYWELTHEQIFESFVTDKPMHLGEPDNVDGPGCIECGKHWMSARYEPCEPEDDEYDEDDL